MAILLFLKVIFRIRAVASDKVKPSVMKHVHHGSFEHVKGTSLLRRTYAFSIACFTLWGDVVWYKLPTAINPNTQVARLMLTICSRMYWLAGHAWAD
ncbi:hypothetical protein [Shewanella psychrophila]|uniref:hypothetical protein n=1 Tax=Shewanella psychrophila TaxID=225848 RepID=UPI00098BBB71|nr:hypothetical protein [Shewanella psychrophila]